MADDIDMGNEFGEFRDELFREAEFSGDPQRAVFFQMYAELAAENGDAADLIYTPVYRDGPRGYQVDGYAWDSARGELHLAVCDYHAEDQLQTINIDRPNQLFGKVRRFCEQAVDSDFLLSLEETSPAFELANLIYEVRRSIRRIRCILFSNARLATRKKTLEAEETIGAKMALNIIDFTRYVDIANAQGGTEPIEIDVQELNNGLLPCLDAHDGNSEMESYLVVMPGQLLARIYGLYGARLMEQNVRTFLQARTKANKGIIETASERPERFFAYNNGITATASEVKIEKHGSSGPGIAKISNLQIVNGGQTTASLLYASDRGMADLSRVFVQMKLTVIDPEKVEKIVPLISRYANTQNKVTEADFFSNHEFHVEMQKISRRLAAPAAASSLATTKWFYERARGQYRTECNLRTKAEQGRFENEFPRSQVIQKTDLAKYALSFVAKPHIVSRGAQKCFVDFANEIEKSWESSRSEFNDSYFKGMVAKTIVFRWLDQHVGNTPWYKEDRGYKANIITYTLAWLVHHLQRSGRGLDYSRIWSEQGVPEQLQEVLAFIAPRVAEIIKSPPPKYSNIGEYTKRDECWDRVKGAELECPLQVLEVTISLEEEKQRKRDGKDEGKIDIEVLFDTLVFENAARICSLEDFAKRKGILSPKSMAAISKLRRGSFALTAGDKNALKNLLKRLDDFDAGPNAWEREKLSP
ncbi:MAG: AIPR family protein [Erythrobacter sp.]